MGAPASIQARNIGLISHQQMAWLFIDINNGGIHA